MRLLLLISIAAAIAALGAVAYQFRPRGGHTSEVARVQTAAPAQTPAPTPSAIRSIPIRPRDAQDPTPAATTGGGKAPDVLADVSSTLDDLRKRETTDDRGGPAITPSQIEALKAQAERRRVKPVTRMSFPLDVGTVVPQQVFLHPTPPDVASLAPVGDSLGFIVVGDKLVLVGMASRRIVAVAKG